MKIEQYLLENAPAKIILNIRKGITLRRLSIKTKFGYGHTFRILKDLEEKGIAIKIKKGRANSINLTDKGKKLRKKLHEVKNLIKS